VPGQASLLPDDQVEAARQYEPHVRLTTLVQEFGHVLGSMTHVKGLVTQLRKLGFLDGAGEIIEAGPLLELGIDGERMVGFIRRQVLADLLRRKSQSEASERLEDGSDETKVLHALDEGPEGMARLKRVTGLRVERLRTILRDLMARGSVRRVGEGIQTRYESIKG
jgi:predicted Rossmann fold nucleotide-binding protein DprA/Smf involved in DNA uptake